MEPGGSTPAGVESGGGGKDTGADFGADPVSREFVWSGPDSGSRSTLPGWRRMPVWRRSRMR